MSTKIFINLPIKNVKRSMAFFEALGYTFNKQFCDEQTACLVISEHIYSMLLEEARFKDFTPRNICNSAKDAEVLIALSFDSREQVDEIVRKAVAAGGSTYADPKDHGFMYQHGFHDLDGHAWEVFWMDPAVVQ